MPVADDQTLRDLLAHARVIAVVGHSDKSTRTSYRIAAYLREQGYTVYPVNPTVERIDDQPSYPTLADVPEPVDIVNVFRRSKFLPKIFEAAIAAEANAIWTQLDVIPPDDTLVDRAENAGLSVVVDRCILVDHKRLFGEEASS